MAEIEYAGSSSDLRTNKWRLVCDCKKVSYPPTTMRSTQTITCPKCNKSFYVDYNSDPVIITEIKD